MNKFKAGDLIVLKNSKKCLCVVLDYHDREYNDLLFGISFRVVTSIFREEFECTKRKSIVTFVVNSISKILGK